MTPLPPIRRSRLRCSVELAVLLLAALAMLRTWFLEGFPVGCQIAGGSMAETLLGRHRDIVCADCGHRFSCDAVSDSAAYRAVCPNCGYAGNRVDAAADLAGDRVLIDRTAYWLRPPGRWEVVALRQPDRPEALCVKRVVGLPGESIQIRDGDVYVDGQICRKTLAQQRAMAVLVNDASELPTRAPPPPPRWQAESPQSGWEFTAGRFSHPATPDEQAIDWLVYHHGRRGNRPGEVVPTAVTDLCGYNQVKPRREEDVHAVADLLLSLRVAKVSGAGSLFLWASDGQEEFQAEINPVGERYAVLHNGRPLPGAAGRLILPPNGCTIEVSLVDRQFLLALDGRTLVVQPYERAAAAGTPPTQPLAIGAKRLEAVVEQVRVYRDVFYTGPRHGGHRVAVDKPLRLGAGEYFLLGDNSSISEDSRTWAGVSERNLIGKPVAIIFPARHAQWGPWHFQVPESARMRYIR